MSKRALDLRNRVFGRLTALEPTDMRAGGSVVWRCVCECGQEHYASAANLSAGHVRSCGCLAIDSNRRRALDPSWPGRGASGVRGVSKNGDKWSAAITYRESTMYLGRYDDVESAARARLDMQRMLLADEAAGKWEER